ncbi:MAG: lipid kinase [Wenzhouxiangella sp.]
MSVRTLLLTNPGSRSGDDDLDAVAERLQAAGPVDFHRPEQPEDLPKLLRQHGPNCDRVVLGGGDGTVNLALDALIAIDQPFGILPLGTANDLARSLGIAADLEAAIEVIEGGETRRIDVARANEVSFINAIGMGLGPRMTQEMDSDIKSRFGVLAYLIGIIRAFKKQQDFQARVWIDGHEHSDRFTQITIANGIHYGGGMTISDDAKLDDGCLDVLLIHPESRWMLLANALHLRFGRTRANDAMTHRRCRSVKVETDPKLEVTADGEFLLRTPLKCEVLPGALRVFAPPLD